MRAPNTLVKALPVHHVHAERRKISSYLLRNDAEGRLVAVLRLLHCSSAVLERVVEHGGEELDSDGTSDGAESGS
jgi:hypothetical protein